MPLRSPDRAGPASLRGEKQPPSETRVRLTEWVETPAAR